jgi:hypothetical protein
MVDSRLPVSDEPDDPPRLATAPERELGPTSAGEVPASAKLGEQIARALPPSARTLAVVGLLCIAVGCVLYLARVVFIVAVPMLMLIKLMCERSVVLHPIAALISRDAPLQP